MDESWEYIVHARMMVAEDKYDKAFDMFLVAFDRNPELIPRHETEFRTVLLMLSTILSNSNRMDLIFNNFGRALQFFPQNTLLLSDIGKYLYKYGFYKEAWEHFNKVLKITPHSANAEKNINSIKNLLVDRWHFRMLNDNLRNESYRQAINQTILSREDKVLDVGTGTGLLAIYAYEAGASKVIGCDGSEIMSNLADNIVRSNKIKKIKIINKMSTDLTLWDLGGKCSVLITEMFDTGLFGEHVLQMLSHAWPTLLTNKAKVIPNNAEFFVIGVQCDHLSKCYKLSSKIKSFLNISSLNVHIDPSGESYDCEDVHLIKTIKYLTESQSLLKINFNDINDIQDSLKRTEPYDIELVAKEDGIMNIVIGFFNLYLSDKVTITTNPTAPDRANAWQQAIFFDNIPRTVKRNEKIKLQFLLNGGKITMAPTPDPIRRVTLETLRFLNDTEYVKMVTGCLGIACVHLEQMQEISQICVADLCPFPLFGLQMLKRGAKSLVCCAMNAHDKDFIVQVFLANQIPMSKVTILSGTFWTPDVLEEKFHVIFTHSLEVCGEINLRLQHIADHLRRFKLINGGLFMPAKVKLVAQLVSSHWLDLNNKLFDDNVSNYKMASHLNNYRVTQNFDIDFSTLRYVAISEPVVLCNFPNAVPHVAVPVKVITDGYANAILCWYNIELIANTQEISTNRPQSFINGMLFLTYSKKQLVAGKFAQINRYQDDDGCFKLTMKHI